ncbi:unnamed protein product [Symbiodinium natans]|uniref:Uncharacterized protein n=1 Tax=Symbiodinium natans TaxID=878477 RepID=A0A812HDP6_9DINO|nr:unnamed protein product [Symbiodinium natans]
MPPYPGTEESSWFPALVCTFLAIALVLSDEAQTILPDDVFSHALSCGILAMAFFCMYILIKSSFRRKAVKNPLGHTSVSERRETAPLRILRGVIKKYSEKKEWGVIGVRESESDSESDDETMVRFLRSERDRVGLQPGDPVIFRAIPDPHMQGWLLAETIWKAPQEASRPPAQPDSLAKRKVPQAAPKAD